MEKRLLTKAEKSLEDFKIYFTIAGILTLIYEIVCIVQFMGDRDNRQISAAIIAGSWPLIVCVICFLYCAIRYKKMTGRRMFLYKNGIKVQGTVEKILPKPTLAKKKKMDYVVQISYVCDGRIKHWKSPVYQDDLRSFLVSGCSCCIYVYKNKVCLDEHQPQPEQYSFGKWRISTNEMQD